MCNAIPYNQLISSYNQLQTSLDSKVGAYQWAELFPQIQGAFRCGNCGWQHTKRSPDNPATTLLVWFLRLRRDGVTISSASFF
jgi:hypothetical protein